MKLKLKFIYFNPSDSETHSYNSFPEKLARLGYSKITNSTKQENLSSHSLGRQWSAGSLLPGGHLECWLLSQPCWLITGLHGHLPRAGVEVTR